ncbi:MAG: hypothetical protein FWD01_02680 [Defluviitaleaceae bacterium]|nr:hypothetical protein [Defluviitaleaceae bacterium]
MVRYFAGFDLLSGGFVVYPRISIEAALTSLENIGNYSQVYRFVILKVNKSPSQMVGGLLNYCVNQNSSVMPIT